MKPAQGIVVLFFAMVPLVLLAEDWPQYRGLKRDGHSPETGLLQTWPPEGPKLLWTYEQAGVGYAGPVVVGNRLYLCGGRGDAEYLIAFDLKTGGMPKELWAAKIGPLFQWKGNSWNHGPNVSPTVDGERVYALGGFGDLICVNIQDGKEVWRKNLPKDFGGEVNPIGGGLEEPTPLGWGYSSAPLVEGQHLICVPGGKRGLLAALDKQTGALVWQSQEVTDQASYSSPLAIEVGGIKQYVQVINTGMVGVAAQDGKLLWSYRKDSPYEDVVIATPIFQDNYLYASVGFGQGCDLIKLVAQGNAIASEKILSNKSVSNRDGGVVLVGEHLYGYAEGKGWFCQEFKTGKVVWAERNKLGRGSVTYADGNLYCCTEKDGVVVLVAASPKGWQEKGRLKLPRESGQRLPSGGLWTHPVIAYGKLFIRDQELLFCFDLKQ